MINLTISHTLIGVKFHPEYLNLTHSWPHLYLYRSHDVGIARDTQNEMHLKRRFLDTDVERRVDVKETIRLYKDPAKGMSSTPKFVGC